MENQINFNAPTTLPEKHSPTSLPPTDWIKNEPDREIYLANYTRKFALYQNSAQDISEIIKVLAWWRLYLGIKEEPTAAEIEMNTSFIRQEYKDYTIEKIRLAVLASLRGDLKVDIKPYGTFSPLYIASILNAYRSFDEKAISRILKEKHKQEMKEADKPVELPLDQRVKNRIEYLNWYQSEYAEQYLSDFKSIMWNTLIDFDLIEPKDTELWQIKEEVDKYLTKTRGPFEKALTTDFERENIARYIVMRNFFAKNKIDFNARINDISTRL